MGAASFCLETGLEWAVACMMPKIIFCGIKAHWLVPAPCANFVCVRTASIISC